MSASRDSYRAGPLRRVVRRVARVARALAATTWHALVWIAGRPFHRGPERSRAWRTRAVRAWGRSMIRAAALHVRVEGTPPAEPCVLVANHCGYADVFVLASVLDGVFVSAHDVRAWPLFGWLAAHVGTIFVDRRRKRDIPGANAAIERALANGDVVVLFAEGGNSDGTAVRPFRPALLEPAVESRVTVAWAALRYSVLPGDPAPSSSVSWTDDPIRVQAARFLALERIDARIVFGAERLRHDDRKVLASMLHERVAACHARLADGAR